MIHEEGVRAFCERYAHAKRSDVYDATVEGVRFELYAGEPWAGDRRQTYTVVIQTSARPRFLYEDRRGCRADLYVLAKWDWKKGRASIRGWMWGHALREAPERDFGFGPRRGVDSRHLLKPKDLDDLLLGDCTSIADFKSRFNLITASDLVDGKENSVSPPRNGGG